MSWAGSAMSAISSLRYNRSLTSNKNAIKFFKSRANKIRVSKVKPLKGKRSFIPKKYTNAEYEVMRRAIRRKVNKATRVQLLKASLVFGFLVLSVVLFFVNYPIDKFFILG